MSYCFSIAIIIISTIKFMKIIPRLITNPIEEIHISLNPKMLNEIVGEIE